MTTRTRIITVLLLPGLMLATMAATTLAQALPVPQGAGAPRANDQQVVAQGADISRWAFSSGGDPSAGRTVSLQATFGQPVAGRPTLGPPAWSLAIGRPALWPIYRQSGGKVMKGRAQTAPLSWSHLGWVTQNDCHCERSEAIPCGE